jgi:hypothetical protein
MLVHFRSWHQTDKGQIGLIFSPVDAPRGRVIFLPLSSTTNGCHSIMPRNNCADRKSVISRQIATTTAHSPIPTAPDYFTSITNPLTAKSISFRDQLAEIEQLLRIAHDKAAGL